MSGAEQQDGRETRHGDGELVEDGLRTEPVRVVSEELLRCQVTSELGPRPVQQRLPRPGHHLVGRGNGTRRPCQSSLEGARQLLVLLVGVHRPQGEFRQLGQHPLTAQLGQPPRTLGLRPLLLQPFRTLVLGVTRPFLIPLLPYPRTRVEDPAQRVVGVRPQRGQESGRISRPPLFLLLPRERQRPPGPLLRGPQRVRNTVVEFPRGRKRPGPRLPAALVTVLVAGEQLAAAVRAEGLHARRPAPLVRHQHMRVPAGLLGVAHEARLARVAEERQLVRRGEPRHPVPVDGDRVTARLQHHGGEPALARLHGTGLGHRLVATDQVTETTGEVRGPPAPRRLGARGEPVPAHPPASPPT